MRYTPKILLSVLVFSSVFAFLNCKMIDYEEDNIETESVKSEINNKSENKEITDFLPESTTGTVVSHKGYTFSYNEKYEQSEWVAYKLVKTQLAKTNYERPFFIQDPAVKTKSADWRNYKKSGYDKGHLCPAGDRKFSKEAFDETFFTSNISPQLHEFNNGVWNRLEQKIRYWAQKYESVFVITGGVLNDKLKTIGMEKVAVPDYFYKILLSETNGKYRMIGFLVPHTKSNEALYGFVVPVDEIEKKTGIDFFPQLEDTIENRLEQSKDYKDWSFN